MAQIIKNLPAMQDTQVWSLGWENPLEKGMATRSSILAWRISMDRGAWQATVHRVTQSRTRLKRLSTHIRKNPFKKWLDLWQQFFSLRSSPPPSLGMRSIPSCVWTSLEGFCPPSQVLPSWELFTRKVQFLVLNQDSYLSLRFRPAEGVPSGVNWHFVVMKYCYFILTNKS